MPGLAPPGLMSSGRPSTGPPCGSGRSPEAAGDDRGLSVGGRPRSPPRSPRLGRRQLAEEAGDAAQTPVRSELADVDAGEHRVAAGGDELPRVAQPVVVAVDLTRAAE